MSDYLKTEIQTVKHTSMVQGEQGITLWSTQNRHNIHNSRNLFYCKFQGGNDQEVTFY